MPIRSFGLEKKGPVHPGLAIRAVFMPSFGVSERELALLLKLSEAETFDLISGNRQLTDQDLKHLAVHFNKAANTLSRLRMIYNFFEQNGRRPNREERAKLKYPEYT